MSTDLDVFVDTFEDLDVIEIKPKKDSGQILKKEEIKTIAEESNFHARQKTAPNKEKAKTYNKTFSLFAEECQVINNISRASYDGVEDDLPRPSGSDVVRAALHEFSNKSLVKQMYADSGKQLSDKEWDRLQETMPRLDTADNEFESQLDEWISGVSADLRQLHGETGTTTKPVQTFKPTKTEFEQAERMARRRLRPNPSKEELADMIANIIKAARQKKQPLVIPRQ